MTQSRNPPKHSPSLPRRGRFPGLRPPARSGDFPPRPRPLSRRGPALRGLIGPRWLQVPRSGSSDPPLAEVARLFSKASLPFSEALTLDAAFPAFQAEGERRLSKRTTIPCRQGKMRPLPLARRRLPPPPGCCSFPHLFFHKKWLQVTDR